MHATATTTVATPLEQVWEVLTDHVAMSAWGPGLTVTLDRTGDQDPNGVGAVRRISAPGPIPAIVEEVVRFEAPHLLGYRARSGVPIPGYAGEVGLTPAGAGTEIRYTVSSTNALPVLKPVLAAIAHGLLRLLAKAATRTRAGAAGA